MTPIRLGLLAESPVYVQAPVYRRLAADPDIDFTVIYSSDKGVRPAELGYGQPVSWDIDALGGYRHVFLKHADRTPRAWPRRRSFISLRDPDVVPLVLRSRFDVLWLHGYNSLTHALAAAAQRVRRGRLLLREEQTLLQPRPPWKEAIKRAGFPLLFSGARGLYIGTENRRWLEHRGFPPERCFFSPYSVDNERLQALAAELRPQKSELRAQLGVTHVDAPVIVTVSRLIPMKQPLFLLEAFKRVRADRVCTLLVTGSGELEEAMRRKVDQEQIPDVVFAGFMNQQDVPRAYASADVFTLLSQRDETWGLATNEAMNFGLPVVLSDMVGCSTDLVRQGENGYVVSHLDASEAADALGRLVDDPALRETMGRRSRELIDGWGYDQLIAGIRQAVLEWPER